MTDSDNPITSELAFGHVIVTNYVLAHLISHLGLEEQAKRMLNDPDFIIEVEPFNLNDEIKDGKLNLINSINNVPPTQP